MTLNTSKTYKMPDAEDWQNILKFQQFPLLPSTRKAFRQLMKKASLSFDGLAEIAEQDPAICLHLLLHIKERNPSSLDQINTAAGCISLLGMEEVVNIVKQLPALSFSPKNRSERNYMGLLHTAVLAGRIAAEWADSKPGLSRHQAQWSAMLASAPLWAWQLQQVSAMQELSNQMSQGKDLIPALNASFGEMTSAKLLSWQTLATTLALPNACQSLWQQECWPNTEDWRALRSQKLTSIEGHRALKHQCQQPEMLIYIANVLASQYQTGVYRYKTKRWVTLSAHFLNSDSDKVHHDLQKITLQLAHQGRRLTAVSSLLAPIHTAAPKGHVYLCDKTTASEEQKNKRIESISTPEIPPYTDQQADNDIADDCAENNAEDHARENHNDSVAISAIEDREIDRVFLKQLLKQLDEAPESFGDLHHLMRSVLKGITQGIGLKHAYIMVQNKTGTAAKIYYQKGLAETNPLCHFAISLEKVSIFKRMLEKPASLMITLENRAKMLRGIPSAQQSMFPEQFMMMSLFSNERPIGIVFADIGPPPYDPPMQLSEYNEFKYLCLTAGKSLTKLAQTTQREAKINAQK